MARALPFALPSFVAIDFETADYRADSACAVGLVRVEEGQVTRRVRQLIRPPRKHIKFTHVHGIRWADVRDMPTFGEAWPVLEQVLADVDFLCAHNADFDKGVLHACCDAAGHKRPKLPFRCTVKLARTVLHIYPTSLARCAQVLRIPLNHHEALSDAEACAQIMLEVLNTDVSAVKLRKQPR